MYFVLQSLLIAAGKAAGKGSSSLSAMTNSALTLAKWICVIVFIFSVVQALRHYNRGDMFDGHAHFRNLVWGMLVSIVLFAAFSAIKG